MNILSIDMQQFTSHADTTLELPEKGLVVITGPNGAGKSSFVEAVPTAAWGKTLRGTDPWRSGVPGRVTVRTDRGVVGRRVTKGGAKTAEWLAAGAAPAVVTAGGPVVAGAAGAAVAPPTERFDTTTKTQAAITAALGELEAWRRTHVFSSADADNFTLASDAERKELLETLLHLEFFDRAYDKCRADSRIAEAQLAQAERELVGVKERRARAEAAIQALAQQAPEPEPQKPSEPWDAALASELEAKAQSITETRRAALRRQQEALHTSGLQELTLARGRAESASQQANAHFAACNRGNCSACGQAIDRKHREDAEIKAIEAAEFLKVAKLQLEQAQQVAHADAAVAGEDVAKADRELNELSDSRHRMRELKISWDRYTNELNAWTQRRARRDQQTTDLETEWQAADDQAYEMEKNVKTLDQIAKELHVCSQVLGLTGVRAHVLGQALGGIEAVANVYLERIAQAPLTLKLRPYSETKGGVVQDKISLEVIGAGGGHGYRAASGGERRRIDAALLLALAEVAAAAAGRKPGTLFFDEVFDALDESGVDAVAGALVELAQDRAIVVITHSEVLATRIPASRRVRVVDGQIV